MIRRFLFAVLALLLGYGVASSKEMELGMQCDALGDAFADYSAKKSDPDMEKATALYQEGASECKDGRCEDGLNKVSNAMGMLNDGMEPGGSGRR